MTGYPNEEVTCGPCGQKFNSWNEYFKHNCPKTGFNPTQVEHEDALSRGRFSLQSKAALARGDARKNAKEKKKA